MLEKSQKSIISFEKENKKLKKEFFGSQTKITKSNQKLDAAKNEIRQLNDSLKELNEKYKKRKQGKLLKFLFPFFLIPLIRICDYLLTI